ncbi:MAG: hypothetical protein Q9163_001403 [Psora crenata]
MSEDNAKMEECFDNYAMVGTKGVKMSRRSHIRSQSYGSQLLKLIELIPTRTTTYKPSPLSIGSPRTSPFRRPESPSTQFRRADSPSASSTGSHPTTPTPSPTKPHQPILTSPSKLHNESTPPPYSSQPDRMPRGLTPSSFNPPASPTRSTTSSTATAVPQPHTPPGPPPSAPAASRHYPASNITNASLSQLPAPLLNQLRQAFSLLDRSSTGSVSRADVAATLADLGLPSGNSDATPFFPPGASQQLPLAQFLSSLGNPLAQFSREQELLNAFGAFDERDSGEVDVGILKDSLMHTGGERGLSEKDVDEALAGFTGRKLFGKGGGMERGEVFRYREWMGEIIGHPEVEKVGIN